MNTGRAIVEAILKAKRGVEESEVMNMHEGGVQGTGDVIREEEQ